jgi:hypothetical protein
MVVDEVKTDAVAAPENKGINVSFEVPPAVGTKGGCKFKPGCRRIFVRLQL